MHITIVIRDVSPLINADLPPVYRTVRIVLTRDQQSQIGGLESTEDVERVILDGVPRNGA